MNFLIKNEMISGGKISYGIIQGLEGILMMIIMTTALLMKNLYQAFLMTNRFHQHSFLTPLIVIDFMTSRLFIIAILATSHMQNIVQGQFSCLKLLIKLITSDDKDKDD